MHRSKARSFAHFIGALLVPGVLLVAVELGLRLVGIPDPGLYDGDPAYVWWLKPNLDREVPGPMPGTSFHVRTNALGLRGPPPPRGAPWTLALGCSTTFGWGVEEDEAWPAVLSEHLGEPVVNGGQPGWSTHQGIAVAQRWLDLGPSRVVLAYIVRDAQPASRPDHEATPAPWPIRTQIGRSLQALLLSSAGPGRRSTGMARVPPDRYAENLRRLAGMAGEAQVVLLAFPQVEPAEDHIAAMGTVGVPVLAPRLPTDAFYPSDPIHLTAEGHGILAEWVAAALP
jgi:hypothetical protein